ncbi:predicted protein [Chaetoceros tenuissimus]|uniref:Uncharacterized protein n=1 Tax=Chaetoceros tenuissimus TaxID=426638 RepID=A0AAD3DCM0_9STRA|nr:predicted protein [Chaetoceros tenuissimus]
MYEQSERKHPCEAVSLEVQRCHKKHGKLGEDCVREELAQKRCFAQLLCRREAKSFYDDKVIPLSNNKWRLSSIGSGGSKVSCAMLVEVFAKPENELEIPEGITKEDRKYCREITHALASCISKKRNGRRFVD